jgi:hypothetical protein
MFNLFNYLWGFLEITAKLPQFPGSLSGVRAYGGGGGLKG